MPARFEVFIVAAFVLLVVPGPAVLYIVARSIDQGRVAGIASACGVALGNVVHAVGAALGLSAVLASSALAFGVVKYLGAAYLLYLGVRRLLRTDEAPATMAIERKPLPRVFSQGAVVAVLNPKTALFFLAFLPQFVDVSRGAVSSQLLMLGLTFAGLGVCTDSTYALLTGTAGAWLKQRRGFLRGQRYLSGGVYVALGLSAAVAGTGKE